MLLKSTHCTFKCLQCNRESFPLPYLRVSHTLIYLLRLATESTLAAMNKFFMIPIYIYIYIHIKDCLIYCCKCSARLPLSHFAFLMCVPPCTFFALFIISHDFKKIYSTGQSGKWLSYPPQLKSTRIWQVGVWMSSPEYNTNLSNIFHILPWKLLSFNHIRVYFTRSYFTWEMFTEAQNNNRISQSNPFEKFTSTWLLIFHDVAWTISECLYVLW